MAGYAPVNKLAPEGWQTIRKEYFGEQDFDLGEIEKFYDEDWEIHYKKVTNDKQLLWTPEHALSIGQLGEEDKFKTKAALLKVKGTRAAAEMLNTPEGMIACPEGYCIVYSETSTFYHALTRADKPIDILETCPERLMTCKLPDSWKKARDDLFTGTLSGDRLKEVEKAFDATWHALHAKVGAKLWSTARSMYLCDTDQENCFLGKAELLKREKFGSLTSAAELLNSENGLLACPEGYCVIFSAKAKAYFVLFRKDKRSRAEEVFEMTYQGVYEVDKDERVERDNEDKQETSEEKNEVDEIVAADEGRKARWTKLRAAFFVSSAMDDRRKKEIASYYDSSSQDVAGSGEKDVEGVWSLEACTLFAKPGAEQKFLGKVAVLKDDKYSSVSNAVTALNTPEGRVACPEGYCIVFSKSRDAYFLLWRSDKKEFAYKTFTLVDNA